MEVVDTVIAMLFLFYTNCNSNAINIWEKNTGKKECW